MNTHLWYNSHNETQIIKINSYIKTRDKFVSLILETFHLALNIPITKNVDDFKSVLNDIDGEFSEWVLNEGLFLMKDLLDSEDEVYDSLTLILLRAYKHIENDIEIYTIINNKSMFQNNLMTYIPEISKQLKTANSLLHTI